MQDQQVCLHSIKTFVACIENAMPNDAETCTSCVEVGDVTACETKDDSKVLGGGGVGGWGAGRLGLEVEGGRGVAVIFLPLMSSL